VFENQFTGTLALARDEVKKSIVFENARPVSARSNVKEETLGAILVVEGRITPVQLAKSLEKAGDSATRRHGETLIALGLMDHALLNDVLHRQFLRRVYEVFRWPDGKFGLVPEIPKDIAKIDVAENLFEISFRGLMERYKGSQEAQAVELAVKPILTGGQGFDINDLKLVGREMGFYRSINGVSDVKTLIGTSRLEEPLVRALLLAMRELRVLRMGESDTVDASAFLVRPRTVPKAEIPFQVTSEFMREVLGRLTATSGQSFFEILGVSPAATPAEVKEVYFELAKKYHPDRIPGSTNADERKIAESYFARVSEAHATLSNAGMRKEYESKVSLKASGVEEEQVTTIIQSELEFQKGQILIRKGDFTAALQHLSQAVSLYDKEPEYYAYLGWAVYREAKKKVNPAGVRKGKDFILKAVKERESMAEAYYFLGMIEKADGDTAKAKQYFEKTIEKAPRHNEANSELRALNRRSEKEQTKGGLKGFFGKKP
jgi:DnaJ-domain-containing protein 1